MSYEVGVFNRAIPSLKTREAEKEDHPAGVLTGQAEAEELAESPLPPDPGTHFPYLDSE